MAAVAFAGVELGIGGLAVVAAGGTASFRLTLAVAAVASLDLTDGRYSLAAVAVADNSVHFAVDSLHLEAVWTFERYAHLDFVRWRNCSVCGTTASAGAAVATLCRQCSSTAAICNATSATAAKSTSSASNI